MSRVGEHIRRGCLAIVAGSLLLFGGCYGLHLLQRPSAPVGIEIREEGWDAQRIGDEHRIAVRISLPRGGGRDTIFESLRYAAKREKWRSHYAGAIHVTAVDPLGRVIGTAFYSPAGGSVARRVPEANWEFIADIPR